MTLSPGAKVRVVESEKERGALFAEAGTAAGQEKQESGHEWLRKRRFPVGRFPVGRFPVDHGVPCRMFQR